MEFAHAKLRGSGKYLRESGKYLKRVGKVGGEIKITIWRGPGSDRLSLQ
jgi:hypothetical protein